MTSARKQISYTPLIEAEILKIVKVTGAHIAEHGTVSAKWNEVNELVFASDLFQAYKADHFKVGNVTKIQSKYNNITKSVLSTMGWGDFNGGKSSNLSGYSGDLAIVANLVKEIQVEIETFEAANGLKSADANQLKLLFKNIQIR
jgi:hypothetical protein